jgi:hypothetical protein
MNNIDTGLYVVEGIDSVNSRVLISSVRITNANGHYNLGLDTLMPAGTIRGKILLSDGGDASQVIVLAYGTDNFSRANTDGTFKSPGLAKSTYRLHILSLLPGYNSLDTGLIPVASAETTDVGTITLGFTGVPTPNHLALAYDSLKEFVTLAWSRPTSNNNYLSFVMYRRDVDSNTALAAIGRIPAADTVFTDSFATQDRKYEYAVACVNSAGKTGNMSSAVSVTITTALKIISSWGDSGTGPGQLMQPNEIAVDDSGNVYVVDDGRTRVQKFSASGTFARGFGRTFVDVNGVAVDKMGNIFIAEGQPQVILKYDNKGDSLASIATSAGIFKGVAVDSGGMVYTIAQPTGQNGNVLVFDSMGGVLTNWLTCDDPNSISIGTGSRIDVCGPNCIDVSNRNGQMGTVCALPPGFAGKQGSGPIFGSVVSDKTGNTLVLETQSNQLFIFDMNGSFIGRSRFAQAIMGLAIGGDGNLYGTQLWKSRVVKMTSPW